MPDYPSKVALDRIQKQLDEIAAVVMADKSEDMMESEDEGEEGEYEEKPEGMGKGKGKGCCPKCGHMMD